MLDGRIDTQGLVKDLRAQGVLDDIAQDEAVQVYKEELTAPAVTPVDADAESDPKLTHDTKKPRKLVKDEAREHGAVKWSIYKTYLKASCVPFTFYCGTTWC